MWLYLEMKNVLDEDENCADKTADYMKYLHENKSDISKWLEFINYQTKSKHRKVNFEDEMEPNKTQIDLENTAMSLYERKLAIYERSIKENPNNFRLQIELLKFKANSIELSSNTISHIESEFLKLIFVNPFMR